MNTAKVVETVREHLDAQNAEIDSLNDQLDEKDVEIKRLRKTLDNLDRDHDEQPTTAP